MRAPKSKHTFMFAYENQVLALLKDKLKDYEAKTEVNTGLYAIDVWCPH